MPYAFICALWCQRTGRVARDAAACRRRCPAFAPARPSTSAYLAPRMALEVDADEEDIAKLASLQPPDGLTVLSLIEAVSGSSADFMDAAWGGVRGMMDPAERTKLATDGMAAMLQALGIGQVIGENLDDVVQVPTDPQFDPVTALSLAMYAFQAYSDPPASSYWESFSSVVRGSELSGMDEQTITAHFAYPNTDIISRTASGTFLFRIETDEASALRETYVVSSLNGAEHADVLKRRDFSVLRMLRENEEGVFVCRDGSVCDELVLRAYASQRDHEEGGIPVLVGKLSLADVVTLVEGGQKSHSARKTITFEPVSDKEKKEDFFGLSLLPSNLRLPFLARDIRRTLVDAKATESFKASVQVEYFPLGRSILNTGFVDGLNTSLREFVDSAYRVASRPDTAPVPPPTEEVQDIHAALAEELLPGQMPDSENWATLAKGSRALMVEMDGEDGPSPPSSLRENLDGSLFVKSFATDTEAWFFHDPETKHVVVAFRGTELVSWQDFFTDAQLFLQRWAPGEEIDLNVKVSNTVGLSTFLPATEADEISTNVPEDASAVHYGFLRAYLSIREGVFRALEMLTDDYAPGYTYHFTGHSLGGALSLLCSADVAARRGLENISCFSFGAPRCGNIAFARRLNQLVPNCWRIVNDSDLVARMPRSVGSSALGRYHHSGRTVLINDEGLYWVEGDNDHVITDSSIPLTNPFLERFNDFEALVAFEKDMWNQLVSGRSVIHHMEGAYFMAMKNVLVRVSEELTDIAQ